MELSFICLTVGFLYLLFQHSRHNRRICSLESFVDNVNKALDDAAASDSVSANAAR